MESRTPGRVTTKTHRIPPFILSVVTGVHVVASSNTTSAEQHSADVTKQLMNYRPKSITPFWLLCGLQTRCNKALTALAGTWNVLSCLTQCGNTASVEVPAKYRCAWTSHPTSRHDSQTIVCPALCCGWQGRSTA